MLRWLIALCYMEVKDMDLSHGAMEKCIQLIFRRSIGYKIIQFQESHMIAQAHIGNKRDEFNELLDRSLKKNGIRI